jgi:hypothetical protein
MIFFQKLLKKKIIITLRIFHIFVVVENNKITMNKNFLIQKLNFFFTNIGPSDRQVD